MTILTQSKEDLTADVVIGNQMVVARMD